MEKKCFVIMPFGSASPEQKKRFDGVYKGIIVPAVRDAGYQPIREDISATPGSIPKSIVTKLAEFDMVIADLTSMNPNVFYELGIRHVFSKSSTVLIISKGETIPFDNASHRVIQYTNELADLDDIHNQIVSAIVSRENDASNSDNVVHDTFSQLPISLIESLGSASNDTKINDLLKRISELTKERNNLKQLLEESGILKDASLTSSRRSVKDRMIEAKAALQKSGQNVMVQLRQFAANNDIDGFADYLEDALEAGYLSASDYIHIKDLCDQLDLLPLEIAVMERAIDVFPEDESVIRNLSDVYSDMPQSEIRLKAIALIENLLGVEKQESRYVLSHFNRANTNNLATLFNAYGRLDLYERTISVCESYEASTLQPLSIVLRNKADALCELKRLDEARETYKELLEFDYYDDTNHAFFGSFLDEIGDYLNSYKEREIAAILDANDPQRFINLAIAIINNHYVRISAQEIARVASTKKIISAIMPLFLYALEIRSSNDIRTRIADILFRRNQSAYAQAIIAGDPIDSSDFDEFPLQHILAADIEQMKQEDFAE